MPRVRPLSVFSSARVAIVAGKGGVGKTTVTAIVARAAFLAGRRVLAVEMDGKPTLAALLPGQDVLHLTPSAALEEYLDTHGLRRVAKRLITTGVIDVIATAAPGIDDIVVLGKLKQLERSGDYDLIVVDGPAAGQAITMLLAPSGLQRAVRGGPIAAQAAEVTALLGDPQRCQVCLVTLPEPTPVNELLETSLTIRERVGVALGPVVVNAVDQGPPLSVDGLDEDGALAQAALFTSARRALHAAQVERVRAEFGGEPLVVPMLSGAALDAAAVDEVARAVMDGWL